MITTDVLPLNAELCRKVDWLQNELGLSDGFFSAFLGVAPQAFASWRRREGQLSTEQNAELAELWRTMLHLLSFVNFDTGRLAKMVGHHSTRPPGDSETSFDPPWVGTTMKLYLEAEGVAGTRAVDTWVQGLRFGEP